MTPIRDASKEITLHTRRLLGTSHLQSQRKGPFSGSQQGHALSPGEAPSAGFAIRWGREPTAHCLEPRFQLQPRCPHRAASAERLSVAKSRGCHLGPHGCLCSPAPPTLVSREPRGPRLIQPRALAHATPLAQNARPS